MDFEDYSEGESKGMEREYIYDAFISYRHTEFDKAVADRLQKLLEKYVPPTAIVPKSERKKLRLFRDETELASSSNLSDEIKRALEASRFLIVICSKSTKESLWCRQEIEHFKELHNGSTSNILTLLIEGEPSEVFPKELCFETYTCEGEDGSSTTETREVEPLATNIVASTRKESLKKLNQEYLRLVAPLLGCRYDDLFNRNQRRRNRRNMLIASSLIVFLALFGIYSSIMMVQINTQRAEAIRNLEEVKYLLLSSAIDYAQRLNEQGARARAGAVLLSVYENIDDSREDADLLYSRFRDVALDTLYYMDESLPFARQELSSEIRQIIPVEEHGYAIAVTTEVLYQIDLYNGNILATFAAPEGDEFLIVNIHDVYILAITEEREIVVINTMADNADEYKVLNIKMQYYDQDRINSIHFNEEIAALTIVNAIYARFDTDADSLTFIPSGEDERFTKIILTIIPFDFYMMQKNEEEIQRLVYQSDDGAGGIGDTFYMSENGRFLAFRNQFVTTLISDDDPELEGWIGTRNIPTNSDVTVVDIDRFCFSLNRESNHQSMSKVIDVRFNDEEFFRISEFTISNQGLLKLDGHATTIEEGFLTDYSTNRIVVYDTMNNEVLFNEQLATEDTNLWRSGFLEVSNQYYHEYVYYVLEFEGTFFPIDSGSPESAIMIEEIRAERGVECEKRVLTHRVGTERWLLYLDEREESSYLKIFDLLNEWEQLAAMHAIPENFRVHYSFVIHEIETLPLAQVVLVGERSGRSEILYFPAGIFWVEEITIEKQTLDIIPSSGAMASGSKRILVGHPNGTVLMYNFGVFSELEYEGMETRRSVEHFGGAVLMGGEETGVILQKVTEATSINLQSYNLDRTKIFGYESDVGFEHRVYSIWSLETGEAITSFCSSEFVPEGAENIGTPGFSMEINSIFTYVIAEIIDSDYRRYNVIDVSSGETVHQYERYLPMGNQLLRERMYYGIGEEPDIMWLFNGETLILEEVDLQDGNIVRRRFVSERIGDIEDGVDWLARVYYKVGGDLIIFEGGMGRDSFVYSFLAGRSILTDRAEFMSDFFDIYLDTSALYAWIRQERTRIALKPDALFEALGESKFIGAMTEEDLRETGLYIFDQN